MSNTIDPASFRDPSGFIFNSGGKVLRQVNRFYCKQYNKLIESGLYDRLVSKGLLVAHNEVDIQDVGEEIFKILEPTQIELISYPYEWCFSQYKDAALTTLQIHKLALEYGMILKDASAYNIQFIRGKAIHIDTLSFDFYNEYDPWIAYGQFCRHFLAPLFLMAYTDIRLSQLLRVYIDGIPLDLASKLLVGKGGFSVKAHIHWHAKSVARHGQTGQITETSAHKLTVSKSKMTAMIDSLIRIIERLHLNEVKTEWGDYYTHTNYSNLSTESKQAIVKECLTKIKHTVTWDFGANDGTYSRLALMNDKSFIAAFDIDPIAVERNYTVVRNLGQNILPLLLDLTNPSPAIGFSNRERKTIVERQTPDCTLMLAIIHHLAISNNLPLGMLAKWLASFSKYLIIEFIAKSDSQVKILLSTREDIFPNYTEHGFETAFNKYYNIIEKRAVNDCVRLIYLMERIP